MGANLYLFCCCLPVICSVVWQLWCLRPAIGCAVRHWMLRNQQGPLCNLDTARPHGLGFSRGCCSLALCPLSNHLTCPTSGFLGGEIKVCPRCALKSLPARKGHEFTITRSTRLRQCEPSPSLVGMGGKPL